MKPRKMAGRPFYIKEIVSCYILSKKKKKKNGIKDKVKRNDKAEQLMCVRDRSFVVLAATQVHCGDAVPASAPASQRKAAADSGEDRWMALAGASLSPTHLTRQTQELTNTLGNLSLGLTELQAAYSLTRKALALT